MLRLLAVNTFARMAGMFLLSLPHGIMAQGDSIHMLREVEVTATRINFTGIGKHTDQLDSSGLSRLGHHHLASMLAMQTPLYIRSYGNGTLATLGIRGGSAAHTQLVWNGIPIRNPMIGLVDLALIPAWIMDDASVHYGGHGAAFGSGAIGGLISFSNQPLQAGNHAQLHVLAGSWGEKGAQVKLEYGFEHLRFSTRAFHLFADNNFRYDPGHGLPDKFQSNHRVKDQGVLQEIMWVMNEKQKLVARAWYQHADRQIPPTSTQTTSKSAQQDDNFRASLHWHLIGDKVRWQLKTALLDESIDYQDSLILLYTHNRFQTWLAEAETAFRLTPDIDFTGGLYTERVEAKSDNYLSNRIRHQHAAFISLRETRPSWLYRLQVREEYTDGSWSPLLLDFSAEWSGLKKWIWKTSLSRNYRLPTLNDLYWRPGGNSGLQPESGWTVESGLDYKYNMEHIQFSGSLTGYFRKVDQWIMWLPPVKDVRNYWSPINIAEVNSRGMEWRMTSSWNTAQWRVQLHTSADLTWSTFGSALPDLHIEPGDQLFYVPVENVMIRLQAGFHRWSGFYQHHWFGDSPGINEAVQAGNVGAVGLSYDWERKGFGASIYAQSENIWDVPYRLIERRPMPGRSFELGIRLSL